MSSAKKINRLRIHSERNWLREIAARAQPQIGFAGTAAVRGAGAAPGVEPGCPGGVSVFCSLQFATLVSAPRRVIMSTILGTTKDTYIFESDSIHLSMQKKV